jgi:hypothetical protein
LKIKLDKLLDQMAGILDRRDQGLSGAAAEVVELPPAAAASTSAAIVVGRREPLWYTDPELYRTLQGIEHRRRQKEGVMSSVLSFYFST